METKDIILDLRTKKGLSQEELAEKMFVTRQAVSRWENGETIPNIDTLKLLSKYFDVSINTLLGSPQQLVCKCCGMNLEDCDISKEINGNFNEEIKNKIIDEINSLLCIEGLPKVENLNVLSGSFINLEYRLPNGEKVKFLDDKASYLGSQLESEFGGDRCFGIAANMDFILICSYEKDGENPELIMYKKR